MNGNNELYAGGTEEYYDESMELSDSYLANNKLIINHEERNFLEELQNSLNECEKFYMSVAFINFSGLQLLLDTFKELEAKGVKGKILTSTYLNFTEPKALRRIKEFSNIDLKIFIASREVGFHTKAYIFEKKDVYKIIIGSSNITQSALKSNIEWNVSTVSKKDNTFARDVIEEYLKLWERTDIVDREFIEKYDALVKEINKNEGQKQIQLSDYESIRPNPMQRRAVANLSRLRRMGENKALVIAATGTGKTYMSAFDVIEYRPQKLLFIVHREEILHGARRAFSRLVKNKNIKMGIYTGSRKDEGVEFLFATIQSIYRNLHLFNSREFEYIIIDEAHHASSPTYMEVLKYFKPQFLLGMTATPERSDGKSIYGIFDHNVAVEVRLHDAMDMNLVTPFHYFGITDIEDVDLSDVSLNDIQEISKRLKVNKRVDFIIEKMNFYGHDGYKRKALGFCVNIDHAEFMAKSFNDRGIESICLTGLDAPEDRQRAIERIEDEEDSLEVIFTVDIFNEGVDIPSINLVLMLRPTNSPIIFIQQLGRGLRKHEDKAFLTVLDFIGNHQKVFLIAIALYGERYYDKDSLKVAVATGFGDIPGCSHIQMDRISQKRILRQLETENFNLLKYVREEYEEFKKMNNGKIAYYLMDYLKYEGAPDPLKFVKREKTYIGFVAKEERDEGLYRLLSNEQFSTILEELSSKLPIKRPHEFAIIRYILEYDYIDHIQAQKEIKKYIDSVDFNTVEHAFECLSQKYYDKRQVKIYNKCFEYKEGILTKTSTFEKYVQDKRYSVYIRDVINYGLIRYEKEYGSKNYGIPFLKIYGQYSMVDVALLSNYNKTHSSFRGSGLLAFNNNFFLFVDLHKEEGIKESINYKDKFINNKYFQWQSPNSTSQNSERGKNIIFNKRRNINLHLFVRKFKEIDRVVQPYIYIGKGDVIKYKGNKPITVLMKLKNQVPANIYLELTKKV